MTKLLCLFVCFLPGVLLPAECPPQLQWQGFYGGTNTDLMRSLVPTKDGGFLVAGVSRSNPTEKKSTPNHGTNDFYVLKVGPHGQKLWEGSFGGAAEDSLTVAKQTSDHGFILGGYSFSGIEGNKTTPNYGVCDYWIVRLDAAGHKLWEQSYGGNDYDALYDLQETDDGGFLLAGRSDSGANGSKSVAQFSPEIWLIRVDSKGDKIWERVFGRHGAFCGLYSLSKTGDGGFVLGGYLASFSLNDGNVTSESHGGFDGLVIKIDQDGNKAWDRTFGGSGFDFFTSVRQSADGGFFAIGYGDSPADGNKTSPALGKIDAWVVRMDPAGTKMWDKTLGGPGYDFGENLLPLNDGSCYIVGDSSVSLVVNSSVQQQEAWLGKLAPDGELKWMLTLGGTNRNKFINEILPLKGGGLLLGGSSAPFSSEGDSSSTYEAFDFWVQKFDPDKDCDPIGVPHPHDEAPGREVSP